MSKEVIYKNTAGGNMVARFPAEGTELVVIYCPIVNSREAGKELFEILSAFGYNQKSQEQILSGIWDQHPEIFIKRGKISLTGYGVPPDFFKILIAIRN